MCACVHVIYVRWFRCGYSGGRFLLASTHELVVCVRAHVCERACMYVCKVAFVRILYTNAVIAAHHYNGITTRAPHVD